MPVIFFFLILGNGQKYSLSGDTVLQLIIQNAEKIKAGVHNTFKLLHELLSWWVISEGEYAVYSTDSFSPSEVMEQLIDYLIQKKNRVKTRIFVHVLSDIEEIDPKLHDWIQHLNNNGKSCVSVVVGKIVQMKNLISICVYFVLANSVPKSNLALPTVPSRKYSVQASLPSFVFGLPPTWLWETLPVSSVACSGFCCLSLSPAPAQ